MDDPNLMQNTTSTSPERKDNMTSVSPPKRTIVLGVVNTTGMKSANINRKRRWDQPPEDISGPPSMKKFCISESEASPVKEIESLETTFAVSPNLDRINSQCENDSELSNQCSHGMLVGNEEISVELSQSHSFDISSEACAMSIDLPANKRDKSEPSSDILLCSEPNENSSEVNILESCDRLQCSATGNSSNDSRVTGSDVKPKETSSIFNSETKIVKHESKSNASATVISHQSDELRRIMFSYDEGSSDSDSVESSKEENANTAVPFSKIDKQDANNLGVFPSNVSSSSSDNSKKIVGFESDAACETVVSKDTVILDNDIDHVSSISVVQKSLDILSENDSKETDAFVESSESLNNLKENKEHLIESQLNIPKENEVIKFITQKEIESNFVANETLNKHLEDVEVDTIHSSHKADHVEDLPEKVILVPNVRQNDNQNSGKDSVTIETDFIKAPSDVIKKDQYLCERPLKEDVAPTDGNYISTNIDEKSEVDKESISDFDNSKENRSYSSNEFQQGSLTNEVSWKISNVESVEETSDNFVKCDLGNLELDSPDSHKLQLKCGITPIDIDTNDQCIKANSLTESLDSPSTDVKTDMIVNEKNSVKQAPSRPFKTDGDVKSEEISSKVLAATEEVHSNQSCEIIPDEEIEKMDGCTMEVTNQSSINEKIKLDDPSKQHHTEATMLETLDIVARSDDCQSNIANIKASDDKSVLLRLQDNSNEKNVNASDIQISSVQKESELSSDKSSTLLKIDSNLKITDSLSEGNINISMDVAPSEDIDPAVMEVILGTNDGSAIIKGVSDCPVISRTSKSDLKSNFSEVDNLDTFVTNINFEEKMDIANEINTGLPDKSVCINELTPTAKNMKSKIDRNMDLCLDRDMVIDNNSKLINERADSNIKHDILVKETGNPDCHTLATKVVDTASNVVKNDSGIDHYSPSNIETVENCDSELISNTPISKVEPVINTDMKIEENISIFDCIKSPVDDKYLHEKSVEVNDLNLKDNEVDESECLRTGTIETSNTVLSSVDIDRKDLRSVDNNDFEISTEETVETEISAEENVENELYPIDNDEIVTMEATALSSLNDGGNSLNSGVNLDIGSTSVKNIMIPEQCDNEIHVRETIKGRVVEDVENLGRKIDEKIAQTETETTTDNKNTKPIEAENDIGDISPIKRTVEQELNIPEDTSGNTEIEKISSTLGSNQDVLKELVIQEEIMDEVTVIEECVYDNANLAMREDDIVLTSVDSPSYEVELNPSPEESKSFEKSIDVSETIGEEMGIDGNVIIEPIVEEETKIIAQEIDLPKNMPPVEVSSYVEDSLIESDSKALTEDIEESFVVEEVVTCESSDSNKDVDNELGSINENISSPLIVFEETCETTESFVNNEVNAVIKENTVDSDISAIDNQNEISNDSKLDFKKYGDSNIDESVQKQISISKDLINEPLINSIRPDSPSLDMECESSVNSIIKTDSDVEMDIVEPITIGESGEGHRIDSIKIDKPSPSVLNIGSESISIVKDDINVPLLTTVNNSNLFREEKPTPTAAVDINRSGNIPGIDPKLEPITLRIYKDNLSVKTDDLDSPKKSRSPKISSELKSQLSPHIKAPESRSSLSPTTKKLEFTLKIAKDVNTNIPRATMSPKNSVSPSNSSTHKPGDILRAELTAESGRNTPVYINPSESGVNKVKLKIQKPILSKDYISHIQSSIKEETVLKDDVDHSTGLSLPKPPIEIGNVFKKMMETENNVDSKSEINVVDHSLNSPLVATPVSIPVVRKRGRPRKILQKVLTGTDPNLSSGMIPGHSPGLSFNHTPGASPGLDVSSGVEGSDQSSRQVRSCRARTKPIVIKTRKPRGGGARGGMRGRGAISSGVGGIVRNLAAEIEQDKLAGKLSEREKAELAKIEERKERQRQERHAKNEAKKAKKLARKLKDEERRLKKLREKAEKAEAAAPQVFEEETRMSAADGGSRGHTPAPASALFRLNQTSELNEESQNSISTPTSSQIKRGRMEIPIDPECKEVRVEHLAEYQWQGSELFMIQEQVSLYLGVKSFKRKYPDLKRRPVEAEERTFLEDSGLVPKSMCDLGLTAVSSAEILDIMYQDFPDKYEEFRKYVREKQAREASYKQKVFASLKQDKSKGEPREQALEAVAMWNSNLNRERREERRCALDLQTFTVHYPKQLRDRMSRPVPKTGLYPVSLIPGQFSDSFKVYTPTELMYFPLNTVMYGPLKPNERQPINPSDGSGSDSSSSSTSDDSSSSSSECESEDENAVTRECKICNGEKKTNRESHPEILLQCSNCKGLCHPTCQEITPEMLPHIKKYNWHCSNCKKCMICKNTTKDDKMLFCDLCDRGYHIHCVGLRKAPEGRWHCSVCSFCTVCGSKDPGGPEWNYEYKKTDKGVRLYQRTLCVPCSKNALM